MSFKDLIIYMNDEALKARHFNQEQAGRRARPQRANVVDSSHSPTEQPVTSTIDNAWQVMLASKLPQSYIIPREIFECIPEEARLDFMRKRNQLAASKPQGKPQSVDKGARQPTTNENNAKKMDSRNNTQLARMSLSPKNLRKCPICQMTRIMIPLIV